jgi:hypothetical protein
MEAISLGSTPIYQLRSLRVICGTPSSRPLGLDMLVNLEELTIIYHESIGDGYITLPQLQTLQIMPWNSTLWRRFITPRVISVQVNQCLGKDILGYLDRHPSVLHLEINYARYWYHKSAKRLADALPALESLTSTGPHHTIAPLVEFLAGSRQVHSTVIPFPNLKRLVFKTWSSQEGGDSFPWKVLEQLINDRCFPNNRDARPTPLEFHLDLHFEEGQGMPWNDSPVLKGGIVSRKASEWRDEEVQISFSWPT